MQGLIKQLKENNQDFEFYPTSKEIIKIIAKNLVKDHLGSCISLLDIGAGNGNFFKILEEFSPKKDKEYRSGISYIKYAIERSKILIEEMPEDIFIVGTDFTEQTLIDKKVDVIFSNPPYSDYVYWMDKILNEANAPTVYMVIPERWGSLKQIKTLMEKRQISFKILYNFSFLDSEYRKARANVHLVKFSFETQYRKSNDLISDPFDQWFHRSFEINADKINENHHYISKSTEKYKRKKIKEIIKGKNLIESLEELYKKDIEKLLKNYKALESLDYEIFKELNINVHSIIAGLKMKIEGLKILYWEELFSNLDSITSKLTSSSREKLLKKLTEHIHVDFTASNAYAIIIWALKNANVYFDNQLKEIYMWMSDKDNIINYKSNKVIIEDRWRYSKREATHYSLDYRLVFKCFRTFNESKYGEWEYPNGLHINTHNEINDIITIGKNLGFDVASNTMSFEWEPGKQYSFECKDGTIFMEIRAYKNGNIHCKPNKEFIKKLNIEAARLNKWVKSPQKASEEIGLSLTEIAKYYFSNLKLKKDNILLLSNQ